MRPAAFCTALLSLLAAGQARVLMQEQQCDANKARWDYSKCYAASKPAAGMKALQLSGCWSPLPSAPAFLPRSALQPAHAPSSPSPPALLQPA